MTHPRTCCCAITQYPVEAPLASQRVSSVVLLSEGLGQTHLLLDRPLDRSVRTVPTVAYGTGFPGRAPTYPALYGWSQTDQPASGAFWPRFHAIHQATTLRGHGREPWVVRLSTFGVTAEKKSSQSSNWSHKTCYERQEVAPVTQNGFSEHWDEGVLPCIGLLLPRSLD